MKQKNNLSKGITLIEAVVVLAVFMVIIEVTVSIFVSVIQQQKRILQEQDLLNQASYAIEYMSRSIRDAIKDKTGNCLLTSGNIYSLTHYDPVASFYQGIKFVTKDNICQEFFFDTDGVLKEIKSTGQPQNILSSKFKIKYFRVILNGNKILQTASEKDLTQPRLTILLDVETNDQNQHEKIIQTTISQKDLNAK